MKNTKLHNNEIEYIKKNFHLSGDFREKLESGNLMNDECSVLRDLCGEKLQIVGFDEDYNITKEGKFLEDLIDKLYC